MVSWIKHVALVLVGTVHTGIKAGCRGLLRGMLLLVLVGCGFSIASPAIAANSVPATLSVQSLSLPPATPMLGSILGGLFAGNRPENLGSVEGKLRPCPGSPNCVCSQTEQTDPEHAIDPLGFAGSGDDAFAALTDIVKAYNNTTVVKEEGDYLYAEFKTSLMGFVDDVEFVLNRDEQVIHMRSASRLGQSDLGLNRKRVEEIRTALAQAIASGNP